MTRTPAGGVNWKPLSGRPTLVDTSSKRTWLVLPTGSITVLARTAKVALSTCKSSFW
jgi:hypothetical protein